jgi:hypothetical protein
MVCNSWGMLPIWKPIKLYISNIMLKKFTINLLCVFLMERFTININPTSIHNISILPHSAERKDPSYRMAKGVVI